MLDIRARFIKASLLAVMIVMLASYVASAAPTPAGTQIRSSATANYTDANRNPKAEVTSNEVVTIVSILRGVDVTPNPDSVTGDSYSVGTTDEKETEHAFTITNTGNAADSIALSVSGQNLADGWEYQIFWDMDGNGQLDYMEFQSTVSGTGVLPQGGAFNVIVRVVAPAQRDLNKNDRITLTAASGDGITKDSGVITLDLSSPVVTVSKSRSQGVAAPGSTYFYTITVRNSDLESPALGVFVLDFLDSRLESPVCFYDAAISTCIYGGSAIRWQIPYLAPASETKLLIYVRVNERAPENYLIQNGAGLEYKDFNENVYSLNCTSSQVIVSFIAGLDLARVGSGLFYADPGGRVRLQARVTNAGNGIDTFSLQLAEASAEWMLEDGTYRTSGWGVLGNLINMAPGETRTLYFETIVPDGAADGSLSGLAFTVFSIRDGNVRGSLSYDIMVQAPVLYLEKSADEETVRPGDVLTYMLQIFNWGHGAATSAVLVDPIPGNTTYVAGSIRVNGRAQTDEKDADQSDFSVSNAGAITVNIPLIEAGDSVRITFQVSVD